ncbi:cytochrome c oxidase assembly factor 1 homolog [Callorhinchus milii]|uniref:Cytochrome C oxidase assembly factor 1 n=1 Tax=Callorhinchus milii TaxID=7868 RepID=V9L8P2_CALMI|nr:cytochrome c oxidase assembly factor 1 homolog [Callorhinchus milii]XP_007895814.1 cytochrome c oxidase assembly factor 1 homolog [Callorhinchus milii]XP_042202725.1 cytochrome c oxidase assembly factor 1 homolog [Callorhinchus milii]|eukprot:gi/632959773/ref/XP_007895813.1/ PREDICTED: cytochrome c oxidase assembly factor 1 homolog [Callorhinchus milii]
MPVSTSALQQMAVYLGIVSGGGCAVMYYLIQKGFSKSEYYKLGLEQLNKHNKALEILGAPPLQVRNIRLFDKSNCVDGNSAKIKIPVGGTKSAGYLHTFSVRDTAQKRWSLQEAVLQLNSGQHVLIYPSTKDDDHQ